MSIRCAMRRSKGHVGCWLVAKALRRSVCHRARGLRSRVVAVANAGGRLGEREATCTSCPPAPARGCLPLVDILTRSAARARGRRLLVRAHQSPVTKAAAFLPVGWLLLLLGPSRPVPLCGHVRYAFRLRRPRREATKFKGCLAPSQKNFTPSYQIFDTLSTKYRRKQKLIAQLGCETNLLNLISP
jgi:hypothetical protein